MVSLNKAFLLGGGTLGGGLVDQSWSMGIFTIGKNAIKPIQTGVMMKY